MKEERKYTLIIIILYTHYDDSDTQYSTDKSFKYLKRVYVRLKKKPPH